MSLFVRSLTNAEGNHVQRILRHGKSRTPFRRAQVIIHSAHGYTVQQIAEVTCLHEEYIRELIRRFNREGLEIFKERARSGRPVEFIPEVRADIVKIALFEISQQEKLTTQELLIGSAPDNTNFWCYLQITCAAQTFCSEQIDKQLQSSTFSSSVFRGFRMTRARLL